MGTHIPTFAEGVRAAMREDPDVILVGELRDAETISMAMTAAETGHLVSRTLHTTSAVKPSIASSTPCPWKSANRQRAS